MITRVLNVRCIEWSRYKGTATPGKQMIGGELPQHLHHALVYESIASFLERLPFFHNLDTSFIVMLCKYVQMYFYAEGDVIIYEVSSPQRFVIFLFDVVWNKSVQQFTIWQQYWQFDSQNLRHWNPWSAICYYWPKTIIYKLTALVCHEFHAVIPAHLDCFYPIVPWFKATYLINFLLS